MARAPPAADFPAPLPYTEDLHQQDDSSGGQSPPQQPAFSQPQQFSYSPPPPQPTYAPRSLQADGTVMWYCWNTLFSQNKVYKVVE